MEGKVHNLHINEDEPCPECGKGGSVNGGRCLECAAKQLDRLRFTAIGPKSIKTVIEGISQYLTVFSTKIDQAYMEAENQLAVNFPVKFGVDARGRVTVNIGINFVESRVKENCEVSIDEKQMDLFEGE